MTLSYTYKGTTLTVDRLCAFNQQEFNELLVAISDRPEQVKVAYMDDMGFEFKGTGEEFEQLIALSNKCSINNTRYN